MTTSLANPITMMQRGAPRVIHSEEQLRAYTKALFELTRQPSPSPFAQEAIELLTLLITSYERDHYAIPKATAVEVLLYIMDKQGLKQRDLIPEFGTESAVSMFISGRRELSLAQIKKLSKRFGLTADAFI